MGSTFSEESSSDDGQDDDGQDDDGQDQEQIRYDNRINKLDPRGIKSKSRKMRRWSEIKQLKRQKSESESDNENHEEQLYNTAHMEESAIIVVWMKNPMAKSISLMTKT